MCLGAECPLHRALNMGITMPPGGGRGVMGGMLLPDDSISEPPLEPAEPLCEPMPAHAHLQRSCAAALRILRPYAHNDGHTLREINDSHMLPQLPMQTAACIKQSFARTAG